MMTRKERKRKPAETETTQNNESATEGGDGIEIWLSDSEGEEK